MRIGVTVHFLAAAIVITFGTAQRAAWASPPTVSGQDVAATPYPVLAIDPVGLTLGGKTGAWGSTLSLDHSDVNPLRFEYGRCVLAYAYSVKNVGHAPVTDAWALIDSDDMPANKEFLTDLPAIDPGESVTVRGWFPMSAGKHQVFVMIRKYDPLKQTQQPDGAINVDLNSRCLPAAPTSTKVQMTATTPTPSRMPTQPMPPAIRQHKLTRVEFEADIARSNHIDSGRSHVVVYNPNARTRTATITTSLQTQANVASTEFVRLRGLPHALVHPAQPTVGTSQPQSAMGQGSPQPNSARTATSRPISMQQSVSMRTQLCYNGPGATPGIRTVNGSAHATFTPTKSYDLFTIIGCNFGDSATSAKAWIYGTGFKEDFQVLAWTDTSIAVMLDPNLSGVQDQDNLALVVQTSDGKEAQASGFAFYAARDHVQLNSIPQARVTLSSIDPKFGYQYSSPVKNNFLLPHGALGSTNYVYRSWYQKETPSSDYYDLSNLPPGWVVSAVGWGQYDDSCVGVPTYQEGFGPWGPQFDATDNNFKFQWGDTTCSGWIPNPFPFAGWYSNHTQSGYALQVWVDGPRGTENLLP